MPGLLHARKETQTRVGQPAAGELETLPPASKANKQVTPGAPLGRKPLHASLHIFWGGLTRNVHEYSR